MRRAASPQALASFLKGLQGPEHLTSTPPDLHHCVHGEPPSSGRPASPATVACPPSALPDVYEFGVHTTVPTHSPVTSVRAIRSR